MATKTKRNPSGAGTTPATPPEADKPNLLRAGLKALGNVRDDVVQHQSRFFEAILGVEPGAGWGGVVKRDGPAAKLAQEALGLRKFEEVFDQRVASALERLGIPSPDAFRSMRQELDALRGEVAAMKADAPKAAPRKRAAPAADKPKAPRGRRSA